MQNWINDIFLKINNDLNKVDFSSFLTSYIVNYDKAHKKLKIENNEPKLEKTQTNLEPVLENLKDVKSFCLDMEFNQEMTLEFLEANCYITLTSMCEVNQIHLKEYLKTLI